MTKDQLHDENEHLRGIIAELRLENEALRDIFAAMKDGVAAGRDDRYLVGYVGGITDEKASVLRAYAEQLREHADETWRITAKGIEAADNAPEVTA